MAYLPFRKVLSPRNSGKRSNRPGIETLEERLAPAVNVQALATWADAEHGPYDPPVVDHQGDVYSIVQSLKGGVTTLVEIPAGSKTPKTVTTWPGIGYVDAFGGGINSGLVIDSQGNIFGYANGSIFEIPAGSKAPQYIHLQFTPPQIDSIAVADGTLYFGVTRIVNYNTPTSNVELDLYALPLATPDALRYLSQWEFPDAVQPGNDDYLYDRADGLTVNNGYLYGATSESITATVPGGNTVFRVPIGGSHDFSMQILTTLPKPPQTGLAISGGYVYGTEGGNTVFKVPTGGGAPKYFPITVGKGSNSGLVSAGGVMLGVNGLFGAAGKATIFSVDPSTATPTIAPVATYSGLPSLTPESGLAVDGTGNAYGLAYPGLVFTKLNGPIGPHLVFSTQPQANVVPGDKIPVAVTVKNTDGSVATGKSGTVTLTVQNGTSAGKTYTATLTKGVANFLIAAGAVGNGYKLAATSTVAAPATSKSFAIANTITCTWIGPNNGNWSKPTNWKNGIVPLAPGGSGVRLVFPDPGNNTVMTNDDIPNLQVGGITITGQYTLAGSNILKLAGPITQSKGTAKGPSSLIELPLTLTVSNTPVSIAANTNLTLGPGRGDALSANDKVSGSVLTVAGGGVLVLNCPIATNVTVAKGTGQNNLVNAGEVVFGSNFSGKGVSVTVEGGTLQSTFQSAFQGEIVLRGGHVLIDGKDPLGTGRVYQDTNASVTMTVLSGNATLDNDVYLLGGRLTVQNNLTLGGTVYLGEIPDPELTGDSEIDTGNAQTTVTLAGAVLTGPGQSPVLTLAGSGGGTVVLSGELDSRVNITGNVVLEKTFHGAGSLTLTADKSYLISTGVGDYTGTVTAEKGTIAVKGDNALGTGVLHLGSDGQVVSVVVGAGNWVLGNSSIVLANAVITVTRLGTVGTFGLTSTGSMTMADGSELDVGGKGSLTFAPASTMNGSLILDGAGTVNLGGTLVAGSTITVDSGTVNFLSAFNGDKKSVVAKGGKVNG